MKKVFNELPETEKQQLAKSIVEANAEILESIAAELFGKSFAQLTEEERNSSEFQRAYYSAMAQWGPMAAQI